LEAYGIVLLTGESDAHMYRILCDITARGKRIIERTLGIEIKPAENWNGGSKSDPHVGSFLLPYEFVAPLAVFCLLSDPSVNEVWLLKNGQALGFGAEDTDLRQEYKKFCDGQIQKIFYTLPSDRNVHMMS